MTTPTWITLFQWLTLSSSVLALVSFIGLWFFTSRLDEEKDARIAELVQRVDSQRARITAATATVEASLAWDTLGNSSDWKSIVDGNTGYVAFVSGSTPLLIIRSHHVIMKSTQKGRVEFTAVCDLNSQLSEVNCSLNELRSAKLVQIGLPDVPDGIRLLSATVTITINANKRIAIVLPEQDVREHRALTSQVEPLQQL